MKQIMNPINTPSQRFKDGDPSKGEYGTIVTAKFLNDVQDSVINTQQELHSVLAEAGIEANDEQVNQVAKAIKKIASDSTRDNFNVLANPDGYKLVGRCKSVAELRTIRPTKHGQRILVDAYYEGGTTGGGEFVADLQDLITPDDDGVCIIVDGNGGRWKRIIIQDTLHAADFGLLGNGSDEGSKLQTLFNSAKNIILDDKTYHFSHLVVPANTKIDGQNAILIRLTPKVSPAGFKMLAGSGIKNMTIRTPGGVSGDRPLALSGDNICLENLTILADEEGNETSTNYAVFAGGVAHTIKGLSIKKLFVQNFSCGLFFSDVSHSRVDDVRIEKYRTAVYLKDTAKCTFNNVDCEFTAKSSNGSQGENGVLIESRKQSASSNHLYFNHWIVRDSGEHAYRLGGQLAIENVWFNHCTAMRSGSSIKVKNPSSTEWHGGCGFKVLGATTVLNERHKHIFFENCLVLDINETYGYYPAGHGAGNYSAYQVGCASNVHFNHCATRKMHNQQFSCSYGAEIIASDHVYFSHCSFEDMYAPIRIYEAGDVGRYVGWDFGCEYIYFTDCLITSTRQDIGYLFGVSENFVNFRHKNISIRDCVFSGGVSAVRINPPQSGGYENITIQGEHINAIMSDNVSAVTGQSEIALIDIKAQWKPNAPTPSGRNGSIWTDTLTGNQYVKRQGLWQIGSLEQRIVINQNEIEEVLVPKGKEIGMVSITGGGTETHLFAWYRATSSPAAVKYAGSSKTTITTNPLPTAGGEGNITVSVQEGKLLIENRNGSKNTFIINFL